MMARALTLLLLTALLAGCSEGTPKTAAAADSTTSGAPPAGNLTGNATVNLPPKASLTASLATGSAPLTVNFTLNGTDPEGANLTWTLSVGLLPSAPASGNASSNATGNGTATGNATGNATTPASLTKVANGTRLPANANHTFTQPGRWLAVVNVTDGARSATASVTVDVLANATGNATGSAGAPERVPVQLAEYSDSGIMSVYALTNDPQMARQCPGFNTMQDGAGCVFLEFSSVGAHNGLPAIMDTTAGNFRTALWSACSPLGTAIGFASGTPGGQFIIPAGTGCAVVWSSVIADIGVERTFTLRVFDYLPEPEE